MPHSTRCLCVPAASPIIHRCEHPRYIPPTGTEFRIHPNKRLQTVYLIKATGGYQSSIRADSHTSNLTTPAAGRYKGLRRSVRHIPNLHRTISRPRDDQSAVRRESERVSRPGVSLEAVADFPLGDVPNLEHQKLANVEHSPRE